MQVRNCTFINNVAKTSDYSKAMGGAIYYDCNPKDISPNSTQCILRILNTNFTQNSATDVGGVIA